MDTAEIYSPSGISYDWDNIFLLNSQVKDKEEELQLIPQIEDAEVLNVETQTVETVPILSIREQLLAKLNKDKEAFEGIEKMPVNPLNQTIK
jgi:hypothetical protein